MRVMSKPFAGILEVKMFLECTLLYMDNMDTLPRPSLAVPLEHNRAECMSDSEVLA